MIKKEDMKEQEEILEEETVEESTKHEETVEQGEILEDQEFEGLNKEEICLEGVIEELKFGKKKLEEENKKIQNEVDVMKERLLRTVAEYENFRKRTAKEKEGIYTDACEDVFKNIFPVIDNLERALLVEGSAEDIKKGIEMTVRQFNDSLQQLGIEEISNTEEFNPHLHNAVMHIEDEAFGKNQIVEVFQKGYKKGDKVLRYSMVKVAN